MTGSRSYRSHLAYTGALLLALVLMSTLLAGSASAHHLGNHKKQRSHIKDRARNAVGTPYRSGGTSKSGFDCSGFTRWTFDGHGASLPRTSMDQYRLGGRKAHKRIWKRKNLKKGDLVFHKTTSAKVGHVGIYVGRGKFISSTSSSGVRKKSIYDPYYWGPRWVGAVRHRATQYT